MAPGCWAGNVLQCAVPMAILPPRHVKLQALEPESHRPQVPPGFQVAQLSQLAVLKRRNET